jgi:hypothetical protein
VKSNSKEKTKETRDVKDVLSSITQEAEDITCIMVIEDALAKIFNETVEPSILDNLNRAATFLEELKQRIRSRALSHID